MIDTLASVAQDPTVIDAMSDGARFNGARDNRLVVPLDEAIRLAKPRTWDEQSGLEGITDAERDASIAALESR